VRLIDRFPRSVTHLTRVAAGFALLGLATFALGLFVPKPLPVIFSMSIGHGLGMVAVLLYFVAVAIDTTRGPGRRSAPPASAPKATSKTPE
jgi:hypothetical protein